MAGGIKASYHFQGYWSQRELNSATRIWTCLQRCCCPAQCHYATRIPLPKNYKFISLIENLTTFARFGLHLYIYLYIYCHPQTDCSVVLFSVARHVERLKLGSKPAQLDIRLSIRPLGPQAYHIGLGNYKVSWQQRSFVYIL